MDILDSLNPQQKKAVTHQGSPLLVLAGAGSGKTRVLTHRAAYFIHQKIASPSEVLLLTFTNKAAGEMKNRMSRLLASQPKTNNVFAGTFHSFCCRILRLNGHHIGIPANFVIYDQDDQLSLLKSILKDLNLSPQEFKPAAIAYFIENAKQNLLTPSQLVISGFWRQYAQKVYQIYQKKLTEFHALDFSDLIGKTIQLFRQYPQVLAKYQRHYPFILVDEYQDTNQTQYVLTKLLAQASKQITVVGDASQAIYGWRGADYTNLNSFTNDFSPVEIINLEQNYRSTQTILSAANSIIVKNTSHPVLKLFTRKQSEDKIKVFEAESELAEADFIAQKINFLVQTVRLRHRDIAVLYRTNAQSRVLEEALLRYSIPYVLIGGTRFYQRAEIKDILSMLKVAANPDDQTSWDRVKKALGVRRLSLFKAHLDSLDLPQMKSIDILASLVLNSGYLAKFNPKDEEDARRLENIKELKSVALTFPDLLAFLENVALVQQEYSLQEKNKKQQVKNGVRLMTLHASKGLEFTAVFLAGLEEGILPHSRCLLEPAQIEEERRLCYVGITRAKDFLYLTYTSRRLYFGRNSLCQPSRFLLDIPQKLLEFDQPQEIVRDFRRPQPPPSDDLIYDPDF